MLHPVVAALEAILTPRGVLSQPDELAVYECDGFPIAKGLPVAVCFPTDTAECAACVRAIVEHDLAIIPRGSGTGLAGGAVAFQPGVIVSTTRMKRIHAIDIANRVAVVDGGVLNFALSEAVRRVPGGDGYHFSPDPSSQKASTIGGNAATNAGGINTLKHGVTSNHVLAVEMVTAEGEVIGGEGAEGLRGSGAEREEMSAEARDTQPLSPSAPQPLLPPPLSPSAPQPLHDRLGPDLPGLICGSEGTLGIITRLWVRLVPRPRHFRTVYAVFASTADCCHTVSDTIAAGIIPTSMEVMDGAMIRVVEDAFHYGFPTDAQALLLIEIDGVEAMLDEQMGRVMQIAMENGARNLQQCSDPVRRAELWSARKRAFGAIGRISHSYCTQDACVPRSKLPEVMERVAQLGKEYGMQITNVFHAGDGNIHPILLFDEDDPEQVQRTLRLSEEILAYCIDVGGSLTGEHGVGVEKLHLMRRMFNDATLEMFTRIKRAFDPEGRINEGKLIPSDRVHVELLQPVAVGVPGGAM